MSIPSVLIVDDDNDIRANISAYLEDEGLNVASAGSGEEAIERFNAGENFTVCIMDIRLPGLDGNQTIPILHKIAPQTQFIIFTGSINYSLPYSLQALGIPKDRVFIKPQEDLGKLTDLIKVLIKKRTTC